MSDNFYSKYSGIGGGGGASLAIGNPVAGGTQGSVLFIGTGNTLAQDNANFNFNDTTFALTLTGNLAAATFNGYTPENIAHKGAANGYAPLDGATKIPVAYLPSAVMEYQGAWNPSTNTPTLSDGTGTNGFVYYVSANFAGPISGLTDPSMHNFQIGDLVIYSSSIGKWQLTTPAAGVQSVNGLQGVVVLGQGNLTDSTAGADGITVTNGTNAVWGSGTSIAQIKASATLSGYLSSTDWNTFNNKQPAGSYANTSLSNLATTAINNDLIPDTDESYHLGGVGARWTDIHVGAIKANTGNDVIDIDNMAIYDGNGAKSLEWVGTGNAPVTLYSNSGTRPLKFFDGANSNSTIIKAASTITSSYTLTLPAAQSTGTQFLQNNGSGTLTWASGNSGTVTSVALSDGSTTPIYSVSGSPVTSSGTLTLTLSTQSANTVFAGPTTGAAAQPTFRGLVSADIPNNAANTSGTAANITATSNSTLTTLSALSLPVSQLTGTTLPSSIVTSSLTSLGAQASALNMNTHQINNVTDPTSAQDAATKHYVDNATAGINPAVAVQAATTSAANTSGFTYNNGVGGIGATFTGSVNTPVTIDGYTFTALGQRLLVKNDTQSPSGAFNGIYYVTQLQTSLLAPILTRALDYDQPSDMNNTGAIPVINGTVNGTTQWVLTSLVNTVGTDPLTYAQFSANPSTYLVKTNNLSDVSSPSTAFNNISPMTTGGDLIYGGASGAGTRLPNGTSGQFLVSGGGTSAPSWTSVTPGSPAFFVSSQVTTNSSDVTSSSFTTFSNSPAFTFTPLATGHYKIYVSANMRVTASGSVVARIFNTSGGATLLYESQAFLTDNSGSSSQEASLYYQSVYNLTASTSYTFDIQGKADGSHGVSLDGGSAAFYMFAESCG
jgi:hypothetical protein